MPIVQQIHHNSTNWVGHRPGKEENMLTGQTFTIPTECSLNAIEIFSAIVIKPGTIVMTLHDFDPLEKNWGPAVGSCSKTISSNESGQWLTFDLEGLQLQKGKMYGFKLESPDTYIGVGEEAGSSENPPFGQGQEWIFSKRLGKGKEFSYFCLAFKIAAA